MSRLARNLICSLKYVQNRTRLSACCVSQRSIVNWAWVKLFQSLPYQTVFDVKRSVFILQINHFSSDTGMISQIEYEKFCAETLDSLCDYFEELVENVNHLSAADVMNKDGVLTVSLGSTYGTYVINKQSPNKQIWLSSPKSGPKRFDFVYATDSKQTGYWVYKHTGETLHELLDKELTETTKTSTKFQSLSFGTRC